MTDIPFKTTKEERSCLPAFMVNMLQEGVDPELLVNAFELACTDQGVYDLLEMWQTEPTERKAIETDIQTLLSYH